MRTARSRTTSTYLPARRSIDRLLQVVGRRVIALRGPFRRDLGLRRVRLVADFHRQRRDARLDEAVLIAADEAVALRLRIGLHAEAELPSPSARMSPPRSDSSRPSTISVFSGNSGRNMSVLTLATMLAARHRRVRGEVARSELALLFAGDRDEQDRSRRLRARLVQRAPPLRGSPRCPTRCPSRRCRSCRR